MVFRLTTPKYAGDLSGEGARLAGGRFNQRGCPALYTSASASMAFLEVLVHVGNREDMPDHYTVTVIEVDDTHALIETIDEPPLDSEASQVVGQVMLDDPRIVGFWAPSVIVTRERNLILNPLATQFAESVRVVDTYELPVDPRLRR